MPKANITLLDFQSQGVPTKSRPQFRDFTFSLAAGLFDLALGFPPQTIRWGKVSPSRILGDLCWAGRSSSWAIDGDAMARRGRSQFGGWRNMIHSKSKEKEVCFFHEKKKKDS